MNTKIIDITSNEPHKSSEVICVKCGYRWFAVRHIDCWLKDLHCKVCGPGYAIETGEDMRVRETNDRKEAKIFNKILDLAEENIQLKKKLKSSKDEAPN